MYMRYWCVDDSSGLFVKLQEIELSHFIFFTKAVLAGGGDIKTYTCARTRAHA